MHNNFVSSLLLYPILLQMVLRCFIYKRRFEAPFGPQTWNCPNFEVQANYEEGLIPLNSTQNFKEKTFHQLLWTIEILKSCKNLKSVFIDSKLAQTVILTIGWLPFLKQIPGRNGKFFRTSFF